MQYTGWPDHGVPTHPSSLVKFVQQVRKEYKDSTAPMVVHCRWVQQGVGVLSYLKVCKFSYILFHECV